MSGLFEAVCGASAAWLDLSDRGLVRASGADRVRFLNGMLSCDVASLRSGHSCPGLQLDRRGHILAELHVIALDDRILLDVSPGGEAALVVLLEKHIVADDVALQSLSGQWRQIGIEGPGAADAAGRLGAPALGPGACAPTGDLLWLAGGSLGPEGRRALGPAAAVEELEHALSGLTLTRMQAEAAEVLRIEALIPRCGTDTGERTFPQEARLEGAISFTKGCYIGQEIVARIRSRGAVNRFLVKLCSDSPVAPGAEIQVGGQVSGRVTSAAVSPVNGPLALGYVRREDAVPGTPVRIGGSVAGVVLGPAPP